VVNQNFRGVNITIYEGKKRNWQIEEMKRALIKVSHTFELFYPEAKSVIVCGTFNNWDDIAMKKDEAGTWTVTVQVPTGESEYEFGIKFGTNSDTWISDPGNTVKVKNPWGSYSSIMIIEPPDDCTHIRGTEGYRGKIKRQNL